MLVQGPTLRDAACICITKYDGYTPAKRFITSAKSNYCLTRGGSLGSIQFDLHGVYCTTTAAAAATATTTATGGGAGVVLLLVLLLVVVVGGGGGWWW